MHTAFASRDGAAPIPIWFVTSDTYAQVHAGLDAPARAFAAAAKFEPRPGQCLLLPGKDDALSGVLFGLEAAGKAGSDRFLPGRLPGLLPRRHLSLRERAARCAARGARLRARLLQVHPLSQGGRQGRDARALERDRRRGCLAHRRRRLRSRAISSTRRPTTWGRPSWRRPHARSPRVTARQCESIVGDELLTQNFPLIHAVGRASPRAPRLVDFTWGDPAAPKITLVGKGVCFDTGGLDIKPVVRHADHEEGHGRRRLRARRRAHDHGREAEGAAARADPGGRECGRRATSFRPLDVYKSRKGITVEIGNTDAEGRLVLADALALARRGSARR